MMNMKKIIYFLLICINSLFLFGQTSDRINRASEFNSELSSFIFDTKPTPDKNKYNYLVYVAYLYKNSNSNYCFTLGYILNSADYNYVTPNYIYSFKGEMVLVRTNESEYSNLIKELGFKKIDKEEENKIIHKLYPSESGGFTYRSEGLVYCNSKGSAKKTFFENSDAIPLKESIYSHFPSGGTIELIDKK
jgi:hypothetical protein